MAWDFIADQFSDSVYTKVTLESPNNREAAPVDAITPGDFKRNALRKARSVHADSE